MSYTQVLGYKGHMSGKQSTINRIVMHGTVSPCKTGVARAVANYFRSPNSGGLAHFVVDPGEIIQCCLENTVCWHAPPNLNSIGIELCDSQRGDASRWNDTLHKQMLKLARGLVQDVAHRNNVPLVYVDAAGLRNGKRGVTTHWEVSRAFGQSTHSDPGPGFAPYMTYLLSHDAPPPPAIKRVANPYTEGTVSWIQWAVGAIVDGIRGPKTNDAIRNFQRRHGLVADAIVGPLTLAAMRLVHR